MSAAIMTGTTVFLPMGDTQSANYNATNNDHVILCDVSGAGITINLPASSADNKGQVLIIKDIGDASSTNKVTITATGNDRIDGLVNQEITTQAGYYTIVSNGNGFWFIIGKNY